MDAHCYAILEEYRAHLQSFQELREAVLNRLNEAIRESGINVNIIEGRVKTEESLKGKLELKGYKYASLKDITDILGTRIVVFYSNDVDRTATVVSQLFQVDWNDSVDKRTLLDTDQFGYMSLHYICRIPPELYNNPEQPEMNEYRFEIQMRTVMQHLWATAHHDSGYKNTSEVPKEYLRRFSRLAGLLELADDEFSGIITDLEQYRRKVQNLVNGGKYEDLRLDRDTFLSYLNIDPFGKLNRQIAATFHAEVEEADRNGLLRYLNPLVQFGFTSIADLENMKEKYSAAAYRLAVQQLSDSEFDAEVILSSVGLQALCDVWVLAQEDPCIALKRFYNLLYGPNSRNKRRAERVCEKAAEIGLLRKNES